MSGGWTVTTRERQSSEKVAESGRWVSYAESDSHARTHSGMWNTAVVTTMKHVFASGHFSHKFANDRWHKLKTLRIRKWFCVK